MSPAPPHPFREWAVTRPRRPAAPSPGMHCTDATLLLPLPSRMRMWVVKRGVVNRNDVTSPFPPSVPIPPRTHTISYHTPLLAWWCPHPPTLTINTVPPWVRGRRFAQYPAWYQRLNSPTAAPPTPAHDRPRPPIGAAIYSLPATALPALRVTRLVPTELFCCDIRPGGSPSFPAAILLLFCCC